ncbi:MAG: glutamyl-tRNA reductase [Nitrososphaerota archaeon]
MLDVRLVGSNYRTCPLGILEDLSVSLTMNRIVQVLRTVSCDFGLGLLSTCNRVETYLVTDELDILRTKVEELFIEVGASETQIYCMNGREAIKHLIKVACGLDSLAIGEPQILQQVRDVKRYGNGKYIQIVDRLFNYSYNAAIRVRKAAGIDFSTNVGMLVSHLLKLKIKEDDSILVVGTGSIGKVVIDELIRAGFDEIHAVTRNPSPISEHIRTQVKTLGGFDLLPKLLNEVSAVIVATSSLDYVVNRESLDGLPNNRKLLMIDLSVPRNIDPRVSESLSIELYNIIDLEAFAPKLNTSNEALLADRVISEEAERFISWLAGIGLNDVIGLLREKAERLRKKELSKALKHLCGNPDRDALVLDMLSKSIINKLLHDPTVRLKMLAANKREPLYVNMVKELFGLNEPSN